MKGIVVDFNDKYAIVLDKKGEFIKVRNRSNFVIGHEIDIESKVINHNFKAFTKVASIAAVLLLVFGLGMGVYGYNTPYNYVTVDINPSLEFTVNMFDIVLDVKGVNGDGENLLKENSYKHLKIDKAVGSFINAAVEEGFFVENSQNAVMITVSGKNDDKLSNIQKDLTKIANVTLEEDKVQSEVLTEKISLSKRDSAKELGISPGKLVLIEKLKEVKPEIEVDEFKEKPVRDILASIKETRKDDSKKQDNKINTKLKKDNDESFSTKKPASSNNGVKKTDDVGKKDNKDQEIEPKDKMPKLTVPKEVVPKKTPNKDKMPKNTLSKDKEPESIEQKDSEPKGKMPNDREPKDVEPKDIEPKDIEPKDTEPKDVEPKDIEPKDVEPKDIGPKDIEQKDKTPKGTNMEDKNKQQSNVIDSEKEEFNEHNKNEKFFIEDIKNNQDNRDSEENQSENGRR